MKFSITFFSLLFGTISLFAQTEKKGPFKAISNTLKVPFNIYLNLDSTMKIDKEEMAFSIFELVSIPEEKAFSLADKNKDNIVSYKEFTNALSKDLFYLLLSSFQIKDFLFFLDDDQDGYLYNESNITFSDSAINIVESIDHKKYAYECGSVTYDKKMKIRQTGRCLKDGKLSISELINACREKKLWIGSKLYWKD